MKETELKPCPFCGGAAIAEICNITKEFKIYCEICPAKMYLSFGDAQLDDGSVIGFERSKASDGRTNGNLEREGIR